MVIEFHPTALGIILQSERGLERVKNREGFATFADLAGNRTQSPIDGFIPELYEAAVSYDVQYPDHKVTIYEHGCTASGIPANLLVE